MQSLQSHGQLVLPISRADVLRALNTYDLIERDSAQPLSALAQIFYAYVNEQFAMDRRGVPHDEIEKQLGKVPWDYVNALLGRFEMRFCLTIPEDLRLEYEMRCRFAESGEIIKPSDLSSGEQAVLALVALVVTTSILGAASAATSESAPALELEPEFELKPEENKNDDEGDDEDVDELEEKLGLEEQGRRSELLLLDEPDAHLNTSKVKSYLEHVHQLTKQGVQIIMVTHRPDTIVLAPEGSLFEMRRDGGRTSIAKVDSRAELIGRLAADTVAVLPGVRVVLVEAEDDRRFHEWANERARELGNLLEPPRLVFMPVLAKDPKRPGGGGKNDVINRLIDLGKEGLRAVFRGLIDGDNEADGLPVGVIRLKRYTLENYLADPIALYCTVVNAPEIDEKLGLSNECHVKLGHLGNLRVAESTELQRVANCVLYRLEQVLSPSPVDRTRQTVTLYGDAGEVRLEYPQWLFRASKEALITGIGKLHNGIFKHDQFQNGPERSGLVPEELIMAYRRLATDPS